jgi:hypothetical protein
MRDWETTRFTKRIALTEEDLEWIKTNKGKKSAAGFLEQIINEYKNNERHNKRCKGETIYQGL